MTSGGTPRGDHIKAAWAAFMDAAEVTPAIVAYTRLRKACAVDSKVACRVAFDAINVQTQASSTPHRTKELMKKLAQTTWERQRQLDLSKVQGCRVLVSGAGPVGLRAAVEAAMMGMEVHVVEKREIFSRVNILTLWKQTADDLMSFGARAFYPRFSNMANFLHLGTREIQLVLLKNALLLGVRFLYGSELVGLQAPPASAGGGTAALWCAWVKAKPPEALGLNVEEEDEEEYVKEEVPMLADGGEGDAADDDDDGEAADARITAMAPSTPRGVEGGVAAAAAAFAARAAEQVAQPALVKGPRRSTTQGNAKLLSAMAAFSAAPEAAPVLDGGRSRGGGGKKNGAFAAAAAMFGGGDEAVGASNADEPADLEIGSLEFKPTKAADYVKGASQGKLNYLQQPSLDPTFAVTDGADPPEGATMMLAFEALLLAEGGTLPSKHVRRLCSCSPDTL